MTIVQSQSAETNHMDEAIANKYGKQSSTVKTRSGNGKTNDQQKRKSVPSHNTFCCVAEGQPAIPRNANGLPASLYMQHKGSKQSH